MRKQIRAQEEAIIGAQHLKEQTDHMICDYEKMRGDYNHQMQVNNDMQMNLNVNQAGRRRAEDELFKTQKELEEARLQARDAQASDSREIVSLQSRVRELETSLARVEHENRTNLEQLGLAHKDATQYKEMVEVL